MTQILIRQYTNVAGLVLLIYDLTLTWDKEVKCIWRSSEWVVKITFFLARYWALVTQILNLIYTHPSVLKTQMVNCHTWFGFQTSAVGILLVNLQLTLMLRVYALYERSVKIGYFLVSWFIFSAGIMFFIGGKSVHVLRLDSDCMMVETPETTIFFSAMVLLDQCVLWGLTAYKYRDAIRHGWSRNPIIRVVMRDNSWACLAICCLFFALLPYSLWVTQIGHIMYCLLCSVVSVGTCRMILNMRGLNISDSPSAIELATFDLQTTG